MKYTKCKRKKIHFNDPEEITVKGFGATFHYFLYHLKISLYT